MRGKYKKVENINQSKLLDSNDDNWIKTSKTFNSPVTERSDFLNKISDDKFEILRNNKKFSINTVYWLRSPIAEENQFASYEDSELRLTSPL